MSDGTIEVKSNGGIGLCGMTFIVFLVLKLTGTIAWSWWWITAPLWIPVGLGVAALIVFMIVMACLEQ